LTTWLAGMRITADRLNDNSLDDSTTSGLVPATNFNVNSFSGRKVSGITTVHVYLAYTGLGITVSGSNISPDVLMATLPAGWRPPETINGFMGNGTWVGECTISTNGQITARAATANITDANPNIRITADWISENN